MNRKLLYVPVIKAKEGEFKALEVTDPNTLDKISPLFEIVNLPWNYTDECESKTIDSHLDKIGKKIEDAIGLRSFFVDSRYIDGDRTMNNDQHHLCFLFKDFRERNLNGIPVSGFTKLESYKKAIKEIYQQDKKGICLRIESNELGSKNLKDNIDNFLQFNEIQPNEVDIIIDLKNIVATDKNLYLLSITTILNQNFPHINKWRNLILAATSFPENLSDIDANSIDSIERSEWLLYNALLNNELIRNPIFGDYCIANAEITEMDPRFMQMSASIRYTYDKYWLIVRGRSTKTQGFVQYHDLCERLIDRHEYKGNEFSWGDNYIDNCANRNVSTGNATTWRKIGSNHHFEFIIQQLSN
ncbi:hypothetical protein CMU20_01665 [Elizabethkingia anophelis]|nr:hypothetical protein [Elizabethkingia anophelis]